MGVVPKPLLGDDVLGDGMPEAVSTLESLVNNNNSTRSAILVAILILFNPSLGITFPFHHNSGSFLSFILSVPTTMSGPQCCSNPPALNPASGGGRVEILGGLHAYVVGSPESKLAVLLVSDIFGYEAPKLRKLADKVASAGFYVVVPDFMRGEPYDPQNPERPIHVWLKDHGTDKGFDEAKPVIEALRSKGVVAVGAAGFCWGAKVVVELAVCNLVQAAVLLHPSLVTIDDIKGVKTPIAVLGAENDHMSPPELVKQFEEVLAAKPEVDAKVKIFPKVSHGWTVRYEDKDEFAVKSAEEAHEDTIGWFTKYVK